MQDLPSSDGPTSTLPDSSPTARLSEAVEELVAAVHGVPPEHRRVLAQRKLVGRAVDIDAETSDTSEGLDVLDGLASRERLLRRGKRDRQAGVVSPERLPEECLGAACFVRHALEDLLARCGRDRGCWEDALRRPEREIAG